jgi:putative transposase
MAVAYEKLVPALKTLLSEPAIDELGRRVAFIRRLRRVVASWFVWAVVLSRFGPGRPGFEQARDWYRQLTGTRVWPRPFQMRFKQRAAVALFQRAFAQAVGPWRTDRPRPAHPLARRFPDVVAVDSTLVQVADGLRAVFPGTRAAAASLKVLLAISVFGALPLAARVVAGHRHDMRLFPGLSRFRPGTLLLFDKGFVAYSRLRAIARANLHYLAPMRFNGNALIVGVHYAPKRLRRAVAGGPASGVRLRDVLSAHTRIGKPYDLEVLVIPSRGTDRAPVRARLVIVPGPRGEQRPYLTTLAADAWAPAVLAEVYRLRWQIELVFKELKQDLHLQELPSKDPHAVQIFAWASLIALAVSRTITSCFGSLSQLVGLTAALRPKLLTRALRGTIRLLGALLRAPRGLAATVLPLFVSELLRDVRSTDTDRLDSFARLRPMLA